MTAGPRLVSSPVFSPEHRPAIEPDLFERFGLSPTSGPEAITAALRARAEAATDGERPAIRAGWEALTRRAQDRLELALDALPMPGPEGPPPPVLGEVPVRALVLDDLASLPPLARHVPPPSAEERALDRPRVRP